MKEIVHFRHIKSRKRVQLPGFLVLLWVLVALTPAWAEGKDYSLPLLHVVPKRLPDLNTPREGHAVFFAGEELMVAGGHTNGFVPTATAEYLRGDEWHQLPMTYTHDHGTALVLRSGQILLAGGSKEEMGVGQSYGVEMYNPASHSFTGFGCLSQKRTLASAMELDSGRVIITGNWYADDVVEMFDGRKFFNPYKPVTVGRVVPYLFRTSKGDVLIVGDRDPHDHLADTIVVDRLNGEPFTVPLLQQWKPLTYNAPTTADAGFIGDETQGRYTYLMAVRNFERTREKPELKGEPAGQIAIVLVEDTAFTLLPTICPIPMMSPLGTGPILYDRGYIMADRRAQQAYLCGVDKDKRFYVVSIGYTERPAPLTLYYTDPLPDCGFYVPVLTPQGNLVIVGGSSKTDYDSDNFTPTASAWLIPLGQKDDTIFATLSGDRLFGGIGWWLLGCAVVLLAGVLIVIRKKRAAAVQDALHMKHMESQSEQPNEDETDIINNSEELLNRISQLMDDQQLYLRNNLKVQDVAVLLSTNSHYISECINNVRGQSFSQFVNAHRVQHAQKLLLKPNAKTAIVATESGFSTESSFFRNFKTVTGMTPREWIASKKG